LALGLFFPAALLVTVFALQNAQAAVRGAKADTGAEANQT